MRIDDLDLAAAVITATGQHPLLSKHAPGLLQTFTFTTSPEVVAAVTEYVTGSLTLPAKRLLSCRGLLFRQIREGRR